MIESKNWRLLIVFFDFIDKELNVWFYYVYIFNLFIYDCIIFLFFLDIVNIYYWKICFMLYVIVVGL